MLARIKVKRDPFSAGVSGSLSRDETIEAINSSELYSHPEKELLFKMLNENLIELFRNLDNPKEVRIGLTKRAINLLLVSDFL